MIVEKRDHLIIDLDGVIEYQEGLAPGAREFVDALRKSHYTFCFLTNDAANGAKERAKDLQDYGLNVYENEIVTCQELCVEYLRNNGLSKPFIIGKPFINHTGKDFDCVVVGDFFNCYDYKKLVRAFNILCDGYPLVAAQSKPVSTVNGVTTPDIGFWIAAFEYSTTKKATIVGKPSHFSYATAMKGKAFGRGIMISDEINPDIVGAKKLGLYTIFIGPKDENNQSLVDCNTSDLFELKEKLGI